MRGGSGTGGGGDCLRPQAAKPFPIRADTHTATLPRGAAGRGGKPSARHQRNTRRITRTRPHRQAATGGGRRPHSQAQAQMSCSCWMAAQRAGRRRRTAGGDQDTGRQRRRRQRGRLTSKMPSKSASIRPSQKTSGRASENVLGGCLPTKVAFTSGRCMSACMGRGGAPVCALSVCICLRVCVCMCPACVCVCVHASV